MKSRADHVAREVVCSNCGKTFCVVHYKSNWLWKRKIGRRVFYFCSYDCMRAAEDEDLLNAKLN